MMEALGVATSAGCRCHPPCWSKDGNLSEDLGPALNMGRCLPWDYDMLLLGERDADPSVPNDAFGVSTTSICSLGISITFQSTSVFGWFSGCLFSWRSCKAGKITFPKIFHKEAFIWPAGWICPEIGNPEWDRDFFHGDTLWGYDLIWWYHYI